MNEAKQQEQSRLVEVKATLTAAVGRIDARIANYTEEIQERKDYLWDARRDMDHIEKIALRNIIEQALDSTEALQAERTKLKKLQQSPYFGRFDFTKKQSKHTESVYVGVGYFRDEKSKQTLVYDWRAPIASMFYDYELGPAEFKAPSGAISGEISVKRQMKIERGELQYVFDSAVTIVDDMLKEALSESTDDAGMKNIVATIQRDQNEIIRNEDAHTLIIQGVAGSGKTSIAMHRIAYLLYRFRETIRSEDILIISPNRVFSDYIGNVLPELGEERVPQIGMDDLIAELLDGQYKFQGFFEQSNILIENNDANLKTRIEAKSSVAFLHQLDEYASEIERNTFKAMEWRTARKIVPDWHFEEQWQKHKNTEGKERLKRIVEATEHKIRFFYNYELRPDERQNLRKAVKGMIHQPTLRKAYEGLFDWLGHPEWFKPKGNKLEYADTFPLIYLKMRLHGLINPFKAVKHLLIDEMQDYTPLQYAVINRLFDSKKTILGDASQSLNPYGSSSAKQIHDLMPAGMLMELNKSYRCSWEVMQYALAVQPNEKLIAMKRHGQNPRTFACSSPAALVKGIKVEIESFNSSKHKTMALICKTQKLANSIHKKLIEMETECQLVTAESNAVNGSVIVCTPSMAKGLEFDKVLVADVNDKLFTNNLDRNLLYVACTRAMHELCVFYTGSRSRLLPANLRIEKV